MLMTLFLSVTFKTILLVLLFSDKTLREAGDGGGAAKVGPGDLRQLHHERIALSHTRNEMPPFLLLLLSPCSISASRFISSLI